MSRYFKFWKGKVLDKVVVRKQLLNMKFDIFKE